MSKPSSIFAYSPMKNVKSSPASCRSNGSSKTRNQQTTSTVTESSPRKCKIQTEVRSSPAGTRSTNINVKSRLQITEMSSKMNKERLVTNPSPRKNEVSGDKREAAKQTSGSKLYSVTGVMKLQRDNKSTPTSRRGLFDVTTETSDVPANVNVKTMRSCFERKENKVPTRPPPSPSPSRAKLQSSNPRNNNNNIRGILSSKSRFDQASPSRFKASPSRFRVPTSPCNTPPPQHNKLRRSVSTGTLAAESESPAHPSLLRSHSQLAMTPKHRVRFQDETTPGCFSPVLLDTQGSGESMVGETTNLTVAVRLRPTFNGERNVVSVDKGSVKVRAGEADHCFSYDYCFDSTCDQQQVFDTMVQPLVEAVFHSYNVCLFAYGQTGSGKSYSMMGEEISSTDDAPEKAGIIPRFSQQIFKTIESFKEYSTAQIEISYFEIYNEKIHDLLRPSEEPGRAAPLRVREHPELGPYVVDLTVRQVSSFKSLQDWLRIGNSHKAKAATEMNMNSSRSHSIFTITLTQSQDKDQPSVCSKINLVDLAGSERLAHTSASGDRLKEGVSINRSLLTLGKVISSLAENKRGGFIPYRESVLTWLLRESLGGNSHTAMLATISPSSQYVEETLSTLRYACQARNIVNTVRINERPHEKRIRELTEEIQTLKDGFRSADHVECNEKLNILQQQLVRTNKELAKAKIFCEESEKEVMKLEKEWQKTQGIGFHADCDLKIQNLEKEIANTKNQNKKLEREISEVRNDCLEAREEKFEHEIEIRQLKETIDELNKAQADKKEEIGRLESDLEQYRRENKFIKSETSKIKQELCDCLEKNSVYKRDISEMKSNMLEIKTSLNHDHCESQILMLQTALNEAERFTRKFQEKSQTLEKKCTEITTLSNHEGCEKEIRALKETIKELKQLADHGKCDQVIEKLKNSLTGTEQIVSDLQNEVSKLKEENLKLKTMKETNYKDVLSLKKELSQLEKIASHAECENKLDTLRNTLAETEQIVSDLKNEVSKVKKDNCKLETMKESNYKDILSLKKELSQLEKTASHAECENKLDTLRNTLAETEQIVSDLKNEVSKVKKDNCKLETIKESNYKDILSLKQELSQLEKTASHAECENKLYTLRNTLAETEQVVSDLKNEVSKVKKDNCKLETIKESNYKDILSLKKELSQLEKTASHAECEDKLDTLKKALAVAKSMNVHVQCENRISELEQEVQNLQSITRTDQTKYEEKIDGLFYSVEKYADDNNKLVRKHEEEINWYTKEKTKLLQKHMEEINQYAETVRTLEEKISTLNTEVESKRNIRHNSHEMVYLESQLRSVKDENSRLKKKKVEDEKRISSLEQQVISLTKELLDVKNQLRASVREKVSSESLCTQLQEQLSQQDRKLALTQQTSSRLEDDKENWETPSKVIRRSIAQYSKSKRSARCSFAFKAEEIHQSLKDAEDICSRLKIPWVFQLEPEVTTHSWFDVNVRVWDQRTMSSVRWPQDVFLGWLREMKDTILSQSRGHKLFHSATWMQNSKEPEPLPLEPVLQSKKVSLEEEVGSLRGRIVALERLVNLEDKHAALSAVTSLGKAVTQLSSQLGLSSPVKPSANTRRRL